MDEKKEEFFKATEEKISELEAQAEAMKSQMSFKGASLNLLYDNIKKLRRRLLEYGREKTLYFTA